MRPHLSLAVQYATNHENLPPRGKFRKWVLAALKRDAEITLRLIDEAEGRALNHEYCGKNYATNVLTFPLAGDQIGRASCRERV